jgi:hypothetical protein
MKYVKESEKTLPENANKPVISDDAHALHQVLYDILKELKRLNNG